MYRLILKKSADKTLRKLPRNDARRIQAKLIQLAENPYAPNNNITKLQNRDSYRLRVGNWRVIYEINNEQVIIYVVKIGPRGQVYQ